jgi:phenylacetate-coenzyme A ligase PaaK-like adenylate-forming protein
MKMKLDNWTSHCISGQDTLLDRVELQEYQQRKLIDTVEYAKANSDYYGQLLKPCKIDGLLDLERIPFTFPANCGDEMICVPQREISRVVTLETSGTTGRPKRIFFTEEDQKLTVDYFHQGMQHIIGPADHLFIGMPCRMPGSVGHLLELGVNKFGASTIPFGLILDEDTLTMAKGILQEREVTALVGLPTQILKLAEATPGFTCRSVLLSAEYVPDETVKYIEKQWHCEVFEHYGMTEMGLGCAVSCENHEGYHVREADLLIEIIDPETGKCLPDGIWGEIVFTTLTRKGMPFIRYRTGDISRWIPEPCPCGSQLKRLDKVQDRKMKKGGTLNER